MYSFRKYKCWWLGFKIFADKTGNFFFWTAKYFSKMVLTNTVIGT